MKHTLFILALITATIQTFAQSPRIKLNQITKDSVAGSVLISSPTDSGMVYSRDLYISYGVSDTVLILGGDTIVLQSDLIAEIGDSLVNYVSRTELSDSLTFYVSRTELSDSLTFYVSRTELSDSTTNIRTDIPLIIADSLLNYVNISGTQTITGAKTFSTDVEIDGKLDLNDGSNRVFVGTNAGTGNTGDDSNGFGTQSLQNNTGDNSNGFGRSALRDNTGTNSNGFGYAALTNNTGASSNGFGYFALTNNTGASSNGFGNQALQNNKASNNTAIGHQAGYETSDLTGGSNTFLGYNASYGANTTITNATAVGANVTLSNSNTVILGNNADVGIGTTSPSAKLHINGGAENVILLASNSTNTSGFFFGARNGSYGNIFSTGDGYIYQGGGKNLSMTADGGGVIRLGTGSSERMRIAASGYVGIGTTSPSYDLEVTGKIYASDSIISNVYAGISDIRLKQDIELTDKGLDAVMELNPVSYRFIANADSEKKSYGFIAQEIEMVIPDVVGTRHDGMKVLNYNDLISVLTKAIQEQQAIIESQATEIEQLKTLITELSNRLQILENN